MGKGPLQQGHRGDCFRTHVCVKHGGLWGGRGPTLGYSCGLSTVWYKRERWKDPGLGRPGHCSWSLDPHAAPSIPPAVLKGQQVALESLCPPQDGVGRAESGLLWVWQMQTGPRYTRMLGPGLVPMGRIRGSQLGGPIEFTLPPRDIWQCLQIFCHNWEIESLLFSV